MVKYFISLYFICAFNAQAAGRGKVFVKTNIFYKNSIETYWSTKTNQKIKISSLHDKREYSDLSNDLLIKFYDAKDRFYAKVKMPFVVGPLRTRVFAEKYLVLISSKHEHCYVFNIERGELVQKILYPHEGLALHEPSVLNFKDGYLVFNRNGGNVARVKIKN